MNNKSSSIQSISDDPTILQSFEKALRPANRDIYRPQFHFRPPALWLNDPNGTLFHQGYYHLFYQFNPYSDTWGDIHWGHARSRDLVHWEHLPIALSPDPNEGHCFSGCLAINAQQEAIIYYTSVSPSVEKAPYHQYAAFGDASLTTWQKLDTNPLLKIDRDTPETIHNEWRDPFIFKTQERTFMLIGVWALQRIPQIYIYEAQDSRNLEWTFRGIFYEEPDNVGTFFECVNFVKLGDQWVLLFCWNDKGVEYRVGQFDLASFTFIPHTVGIMDHGFNGEMETVSMTGQGYYASNIFLPPNSLPIAIAWIRGYPSGKGWSGCMSLPRQLSLSSDRHLIQRPIPGLQKLRRTTKHWSNIVLEATSQCLMDRSPMQWELQLTMIPQPQTVFLLGFTLTNGTFFPLIRLFLEQLWVVDQALDLEIDNSDTKLTLHAFFDASLFEVFINGGKTCVTKIVMPDSPPQTLDLLPQNHKTVIQYLSVYTLVPTW